MRITDPTQRIEFRGFSLLPPNGPGWLVAPPLSAAPGPLYVVASFGKVLDHAGTAEIHTAGAQVSTWDVGSKTFGSDDEFLQFEKEQAESGIGAFVTARHRVLATNTALDATLGARCVSYEFRAEDTGVPYAPGKSFTLEARGYGAGDIAPGQGSVWVASQYDGMVSRIDPARNTLTASISLQTRPSGIAGAHDGVWFTRYDESSISRIDPGTNQLVGRPIAVGTSPVLMTFSDGAFWVVNAFSASVSRVDL